MRVLVACEFSGIVREAFNARAGVHAMSCDLLPPEDGRVDFHIQGNVLDVLNDGWDMLIAFPPCTYLCNSGVRWLYGSGKRNGAPPNIERWAKMEAAAQFFKALLKAPIPRISVENPIMHGFGRKLIEAEHVQTIQPWMFGHGEIKQTCLWLKNLPLLQPTNIVNGREPRVHFASPGPDRWKERSRTLPGIAAAMAEQWGTL